MNPHNHVVSIFPNEYFWRDFFFLLIEFGLFVFFYFIIIAYCEHYANVCLKMHWYKISTCLRTSQCIAHHKNTVNHSTCILRHCSLMLNACQTTLILLDIWSFAGANDVNLPLNLNDAEWGKCKCKRNCHVCNAWSVCFRRYYFQFVIKAHRVNKSVIFHLCHPHGLTYAQNPFVMLAYVWWWGFCFTCCCYCFFFIHLNLLTLR